MVFYESISVAIVSFSKMALYDFIMVEPLENYLAIKPGEERLIGTTDCIQLVLTVGHTVPSDMNKNLPEYEEEIVQGPSGPIVRRFKVWAEHYVVVQADQIMNYLIWDQKYIWPDDRYDHNGPFTAILERAEHLGPNMFTLPENYYAETLAAKSK